MDFAINKIAAQAHVRLQILVRSRRFFSVAALIRLYKSQVLSYLEYATPALYHAPRFFLQRLDAVQTNFLNEIGLTSAVVIVMSVVVLMFVVDVVVLLSL